MAPGKKVPDSQETVINNPLAGGDPEAPEAAAAPPAAPGYVQVEKVTVNAIHSDIMGRARGMLAYVNMNGEMEGIYDLSSLFTAALEHFIPYTEKKYNDGKEWPAPKRLQRGRKHL